MQTRNGLNFSQQRFQRLCIGDLLPALIVQAKAGIGLLERKFTPMRLGSVDDNFFGFLAARRPSGPDMICWDGAPETVYGIKFGDGESGHGQ